MAWTIQHTGSIDVNIRVPALESQLPQLVALAQSIDNKLDQVLQRENQTMKTLDDILAETQRGTTIEQSMETLLQGLHDQVIAAGGNQAKIDQIFAEAKARNDAAAAAVVANTIAAPAGGGTTTQP